MHMRLCVSIWIYLAISACSGAGSNFVTGRQALIRGEPDNALAFFERVAQTDPRYIVNSHPPQRSIWTYAGRAHYNAGRYAEARGAFDKALAQLKDDHIARLYRGLTMLRGESTALRANALSLQEVAYALREGVLPRRVSALARERGVAFDLNAETENQLKTSGADAALLEELKKIRGERVLSNYPTTGQLNQGATEVAAALSGLRGWLEYTISYTAQGAFWDKSGALRAEILRGQKATAASQKDFPAILSSGESVGYILEEEIDRVRVDEASERQRQSR